jgi:hypothetical protein
MMVVEGAGDYANVVLLLRAPYGEATLNRSGMIAMMRSYFEMVLYFEDM